LSSYVDIRQNVFITNIVTIDKEGYFIMINELIHQDDLSKNIHLSNYTTSNNEAKTDRIEVDNCIIIDDNYSTYFL
jgi:hypothetical protein